MAKFRQLASQLCGIFPYCCLQLTLGAVVGFQIILIAELHNPDSEIATSIEQLTSLDLLKLAGSIITGLLMHRLGNRAAALIVALIFITAGLLYFYSNGTTILFIGRTLTSMIAPQTLFAPSISEISEPRYRGTFLAIAQMSYAVGMFFSLLLGSLMYWRTIALVNLVFPISAAATALLTPNSPTWLASKGRLDEAEKALCWFRGWVGPDQVRTEFRLLTHRSETSTSDHAVMSYRQRTRQFLRLFLQRSFYVPLGTMSAIFLLYSFSGVETMENYATVVFRELHSPIEESIATAITAAMGVVGNLIVLLVIRRTGKRKLVFFSVFVTGCCQLIVAIVGFSKLQNDYAWIPPIAVIFASLADATGIGPLKWMVAGELFPTSVRYIGTSISVAIKMTLKSMASKVFLYAVEALALSGVFLLFASVNLLALVTYYFVFPETEGRSLEEIEDDFKSVENTKVPK